MSSSLEYIQYYIDKLWKSRNAVLNEEPDDFTKMSLEDIENMFIELCENCKCGYFNINDLKLTRTDLITLYEYLITLNEGKLFQRLERNDEAIQYVVVEIIDEYDFDTHMNWPKTIKEKNSKQLHESIITLVEDIEELIRKIR